MNRLYQQFSLQYRCRIQNGVFTWSTIGKRTIGTIGSSDDGDVDMAEPESTPEAASSSQK